jgi:amino acid adenylation domain-containing protein
MPPVLVDAEATIGGRQKTTGASERQLSRSQRQLWFAEQVGAHPAGFLVPVLLRLTGALDVAALRAALAAVVARHEVLRTSLRPGKDAPVGVLRDAELFELTIDAYTEAELLAMGGLDELLFTEVTTPIDVMGGLPVRARLIRLAEQDHVLCLTVHHIAFDDWSRGVLYRELSEFYRAYLAGVPGRVPALELQYHELAAIQELHAASELEEQLGYWRAQLSGLAPFELTPERPRPARRAGLGDAALFTVPAAVADRLAALGRRHGATLAMVLFAACQMVLRQYSGRDDVTVGTSMAMRQQPGAESVIGPLINTLVLRGDTSGDPSFVELIERMRDLTLDAFDNGDVPFGLLVEELDPVRDLSRTPLYQIMIGYSGAQNSTPELPGLTATELPVPGYGSKWDMNIWFDHRVDGTLVGDIGWDSSLYERQTMQRLAAHLNWTLAEVAGRPDVRISEIQLVQQDETDLVHGFAVGPRIECPSAGLHERFEQQVARTPDAVAVVDHDGTASTYAEINTRANRLAHRLRALGVGPEVLVGVCAERSVELVVALLGILKAGGGYLPLDPEYPQDRTAFMISDAGAPVVLAQRRLRDALPQTAATVLTLDDESTWDGCGTENPPVLAGVESVAYVIYTSGSTGNPKGVLLTHGSVATRLDWMQRLHPLGADDAVLQKAPTTFDASVSEFFWPLAVGARLVLARPGGQKDLRYLRDLIVTERVTVAQFVPSMLTVFLGEEGIEACTSLRLVVPGGEELPVATATEFVRRLPDCDLFNGYGPTETAIYANWWHCRTETLAGLATVPLGGPFGNTQTYVLDDQLRPVAPGAVGELFIGGIGVARGYLNRPRLTAERFLPDPFSTEPGARLYRTGDLVRLRPDGRSLEFLGRIDQQVKVRGFRIELGEVEAALGAHPSVDAAAASVWDADSADRRLVGYVTAAAGQQVDPAQLRAFLGGRLPAHAVPSDIVLLDELPRLPSGKIDRRALPGPQQAGPAGGERIAASTPMQELLVAIWAEVLGLPQVGIHDNFFEIGGHSLSSIRAVNRMRERLDTDVALSLLFEYPTVAGLAGQLELIVHSGSTNDGEVN